MPNLKKITTTVSLLSLGALSVVLFSTGCDDSKTTGAGGAGGAGGKSSAGGQAGSTTGTGGAAGGHGGTTGVGGAAGGHGGTTGVGGATGGNGGSAAGGAGGSTGGHGGSGGTAGANGGAGGTSAGGAGGQATTIIYNIPLTGAMEVLTGATAASSGMGSAMVTLDTVAMTVSVSGSFTGLTSAATMAHIHGPAAVGVNASVIVPLTATAATAGAISGSGPLTAQQVSDMKNGLTYVNVHSSAPYTGGEIRGQIQ